MSASDSGAAPLLSVEHLSVDFSTRAGVVRAVRDVSFDIGAGETLAVLGESGSGKSVTSLAIMGLVPRPGGTVTGGRVLFDGIDLTAATPETMREIRGRRIGMIFQDPLSSLNPVHTVGAQIDEMFTRHEGASRRAARARTLELMDRVKIPDPRRRADTYPHEFSGGMRQRVMIAMAISLHPQLLIADEPTTALDVTVQAQIMELLAELQDEFGMSLLFITHDLGVVAPIADRVAVMYAGQVVETGPTRDVYDAPRHPYTAGLLASLPDLSAHRMRLIPIPGNPPNPIDLPLGCAFSTRCAFATEFTRSVPPQLETIDGDRQVACHRHGELAARLKEVSDGSLA